MALLGTPGKEYRGPGFTGLGSGGVARPFARPPAWPETRDNREGTTKIGRALRSVLARSPAAENKRPSLHSPGPGQGIRTGGKMMPEGRNKIEHRFEINQKRIPAEPGPIFDLF